MGTHKTGSHPSGLAYTTNVNLSQPESIGNTCQGSLPYTIHNPLTQLEPAYLTLEYRTRWPSKEMPTSSPVPPCSHVTSSTLYKTCSCPKSLGKRAPLLVGHYVPPIHQLSSLGQRTSHSLLSCFRLVIWQGYTICYVNVQQSDLKGKILTKEELDLKSLSSVLAPWPVIIHWR